jgi:anti-sigma B factor antagonist
MTKCTEKDRKNCIVWTSFQTTPEELDNIKCWVLKGVYQEENKAQLLKCRKCNYYLMLNNNSGIDSDLKTDVAIVTCDGVLNNDRTRALEKVWITLKKNSKFKVIVDFSNVNNIYSCGLGLLVKMHKEAIAEKGSMIITGAQGYVLSIFTSTKLTKLLHLAADKQAALEFFDLQRKKLEEAKAAEIEAREKEAAAQREALKKPVRKQMPCWEFFDDKNPCNATDCNECFKKLAPTGTACWVVDGMIEGISFQYVSEDCESCPYFLEFGPDSSPSVKDETSVSKQ